MCSQTNDSQNFDTTTNLVSCALDTFITLARRTLVVTSPHTHDTAYSLLQRAFSLASAYHSHEMSNGTAIANHIRCISSAFHNIAWTLYQGQLYSQAIRFLDESCTLASHAMALYQCTTPGDQDEIHDSDTQNAWLQFEQHLFRRWEILGVCQSKTSDRQVCHS